MKKILLLLLSISLSTSSVVLAQDKMKQKGHVVKVKPKSPRYTKIVSPGTNYVYINDDWTWNDETGQWTWNGNRWISPPQPTQHWVPGHWTNTDFGWEWTPGYWK
ncbi:MAG: hypothetical protein JWQ38_1839 [Flavipsychrobacter sp.]|nr:hypothetical protein [Flavipsychrobacter sp.]